MSKYLHFPIKTKKLPKGIPYIISNEAAERFSFYGMKGILVIYMTQYLFLTTGDANISEESAKGYFHLFTSAVYFFPIFGALISDIFFGKIQKCMRRHCRTLHLRYWTSKRTSTQKRCPKFPSGG